MFPFVAFPFVEFAYVRFSFVTFTFVTSTFVMLSFCHISICHIYICHISLSHIDNGNFTVPQLKVSKVTADFTTPPITANVPVSQNSYQMCQLQPSTLYKVTVSATNIDGVLTSAADNYSTSKTSTLYFLVVLLPISKFLHWTTISSVCTDLRTGRLV